MIQNPFANLTPVVKNLLIINVIFFIATYILGEQAHILDMEKWLGAHYFGAPTFRLWQIISYMFMHGGLWHILFNMIGLVSFGPILEQTMGEKRFFIFYFICGIGALLCQMTVQAIEVHAAIGQFTVPGVTLANVELRDGSSPFLAYDLPIAQKLYGIYNFPLVGASGAIFGILVAFGMFYPNLELMVMPIPVPIKAKFLIPIYIVFELVMGFGQFAGDSVAHFAHLGGALVGFIVIKAWGIHRSNNFF